MLKDIINVFFLIISIAGLAVMGIDKKRARNSEWRISEKNLFLVALLGGGIGSTLGMYLFRHKTKHWYFVFGMPILAIIDVVVLLYFNLIM